MFGTEADLYKQESDRVPASQAQRGADAHLLNRISIGREYLETTPMRVAKYNFFVDDACPNVAEVLLHTWLRLQGLPQQISCLAEALVMGNGIVPERIRLEAMAAAPLSLIQVHATNPLAPNRPSYSFSCP